MITIAISIDKPTLEALDRLVEDPASRARNRSHVIRAAVREYVGQEMRRIREAAERDVIEKHRSRLARQAKALIGEQATP